MEASARIQSASEPRVRRSVRRPMRHTALLTIGLLVVLTGVLLSMGASPASAGQDEVDPQSALKAALGKAGIEIDLERGMCSIPARVLVREELLEYLLVGPHGSAHESQFVTEVSPSLLNTALLALGAEPGVNARWETRDPAPTEEERKQGVSPVEVTPPEGDGFFLYALWKEDGEVYFHRVEDLLRNLKTGRTMRRHRWVYLGSRFAEFEKGESEQFVADREQNLINIAYFSEGNTLITAALEDCLEQTIWIANSWMLPERAWPIQFVFTRAPASSVPDEWVSALLDPSEGSSAGESSD